MNLHGSFVPLIFLISFIVWASYTLHGTSAARAQNPVFGLVPLRLLSAVQAFLAQSSHSLDAVADLFDQLFASVEQQTLALAAMEPLLVSTALCESALVNSIHNRVSLHTALGTLIPAPIVRGSSPRKFRTLNHTSDRSSASPAVTYS